MQINVNGLKICNNFKSRLLGLMFKDSITPLCFPHCNSIHTFFMKKNIDVIMCDKNKKVTSVHKNVPHNKIIIDHKAYYTYELPINTYDIKISDTLN